MYGTLRIHMRQDDCAGLDEVRRRVSGCTGCDLHGTRTMAVPGAGAHAANVMLVGEAPGRSEDAQGRPFVGAAGRRLSEALELCGASRHDVYITNVVKCRPPGNRVPSMQERSACSDHLKREIDLVCPRVICILGNTAFGSMLGGSEIMKHRGTTIRRDGRLYFVTMHPAATIYNRNLTDAFNRDIARLMEIARGDADDEEAD